VDNSTIQSENASNSTDYGPRDSDHASDDSASDDSRSLPDLFDRGASPPMGYPVPVPVPSEGREALEEIFFSSKASKTDKKKSKVAAKWPSSEFD
jgi:hypothetical protein